MNEHQPSIAGLNSVQVMICESLYACDTMDVVEMYIDTLPDDLQLQARALAHIMALECLEDELPEYAAEAAIAIASVK